MTKESKMFNQIKKDAIQARKTKSPEAKLLVTLQSEIAMRAKNDGNREPNDNDCIKTIQKFMKSALETRDLQDQHGRDTSEAESEITVLETYLPKMLDEEATKTAVRVTIDETNVAGMQDMGKFMGALKMKFGEKIDMKLASKLFRESVS